jgi:hypothetical protein
MTRKKNVETETYKVTPEIRQRAIECLVDQLLEMAERCGSTRILMDKRRMEHGLERPTSAIIVTELGAQMALALAKDLASGRIIPNMEA